MQNGHDLQRGPARRSGLFAAFFGLGGLSLSGGCQAFNPAFIDLFVPDPAQSFQTLPNAPGHVIVAVVNRTQIDETLLNYLGGKLPNLSESQLQALVPRIRMKLRITYVDGSFHVVEFITGSPNLVDPQYAATADADLNQNDFDDATVLCDVASVQLEPGTNVEVFVPVAVQEYELVETTGTGGQVTTDFEPRQLFPPQFRALQVDETDEDGNTTLQRNIGVRDVLSPIPNVTCGSVIGVIVNGVLSVPFTIEGVADPSYDGGDEATTASIGGRYEFQVSAN